MELVQQFGTQAAFASYHLDDLGFVFQHLGGVGLQGFTGAGKGSLASEYFFYTFRIARALASLTATAR